jgi:hypothetical protein
MVRALVLRALACVAIVAVAACSASGTATNPLGLSPGSAADGVPAFSRSPVKHRLTGLTLRITIPHPAKRARAARPAYISSATESLVYVVSYNGSPVAGGYANLTQSSSGCAQSGALQALTCTETLPLAIQQTGTYSFALATYDATQSGPASTAPCTPPSSSGCSGNLLSQSTSTQTLTVGLINTVGFTLGAIPASVTVQPLNPGYLEGNENALMLWGKSAQEIGIEARDADGNTIVGPGAPAISVTSSNASKLTVTSPSSSEPNIATLQATTSGSPAIVTPGNYKLTIHVTPMAASGGDALTLTVPVTVAHSALYASAGSSTIDVYYDGNTSASSYSITSGLDFPQQGVVDANGTLYVSNLANGTVTAYPQGATSPSATIALTGTLVNGVAVDASGTLYVSDQSSDAIYRYPAGSSSGTAIITGVPSLQRIAIDASGNLYALEETMGVAVYSNGVNTGVISSSDAWDLAADASGDVYVLDTSGHINVFSPGASSPEVTLNDHQPGNNLGVAVDAAGTLYVADEKLFEFAPPFTNSSAPTQITLPSGVPQLVEVVPSSPMAAATLPELLRKHPRPLLVAAHSSN